MSDSSLPAGQFLVYRDEAGAIRIDVRLDADMRSLEQYIERLEREGEKP